jgi:N-acetylneuraminic acid mutarotase
MVLGMTVAAQAASSGPDQAAAKTPSASAATVPQPASHPTEHGCAATAKTGYATCFSVRRTDVQGHKGLFAKTAGHDPLSAPDAGSSTPDGYSPADLQDAYDLPSATAGADATVAIVDAYDDPSAEADLQVYRAQYGLPVCDSANGCFTKVAQDGTGNYPPANPDWASEVSIDLDMVSAICPNCHILLVEANDNSLENLGAAVNEAVALGAKYVSNSYGGSEDPSELTDDASYYDHPGVVITASAGDDGYGVFYPAASQYVTAVGGTSLTADSSVPRGWAESAWAGTSSGCSAYEAKPSWQTDTGCANRTVADVSAVANPDTGVATYDSYAGGWGVWGGTSVSSPIIASVYALAGTPVAGTYPASYPYADTADLNDVTSGLDGYCTPSYLCTAEQGYDGPTGLGTPDGVAAFTTGPHGTIAGVVTDAATGRPVANAEVDISGQAPVHTTSSGTYQATVPTSSYTVAVKDFGYQPQSHTGVQVTSGETTKESFRLDKTPSVTVSGVVADGSGQGWPLYAKVTVPGTPVSTYTNPKTGEYSLTLPQNAAYTLTVDPALAGYQEATQAITTGSKNLLENVSVPVDATGCGAPGYHTVYNGTTQTFDDTTVPAGWSVVNAPGTSLGWDFTDEYKLPNQTGGSGNFAVAYSTSFSQTEDTELLTPVTDMSDDSSPYLQFDESLSAGANTSEEIDVSTDGGQTWTSVWQHSGLMTPPIGVVTVPLPTAAGQSQVQVRFHQMAVRGNYWELDNVFLGNRACSTVPGGILEGTVKDGNTAEGVNGATVTNAADSTVTATTAPGDASIGNGFYYTYVPGTGTQQYTTAMTDYASQTQSVTITSGKVTTADFSLQAGQLAIRPAKISQTVTMGGTKRQNVTFTNTGREPVNVTLANQPGSFTLQGESTPASTPAEHVTGDYSPLAGASRVQSAAAAKSSAAAKAATASIAQPADASWVPVASYPVNIMDNAAATDLTTGKVYSVGGITSNEITPAGFVYNPGTEAWSALPPMNYARDEPQAALIDGKLYVTGGWGGDQTPVPETEIYSAAKNSWTQGAEIPFAYAAAGVAVLNGDLYVIGGCDVNVCGKTDVQVYDPVTNTWSTAANYPEPISWEGCGTIDGEIYCAGGTTSNSTDTSDAYVYNPQTNAWTSIAPIPTSLWGMGYSASSGELLLSGGQTSFSTATNQGYAYDPSSGAWSALPNANVVDFRGGSACGIYRVGGSTYDTNPTDTVEELPGYGSCDGTDVPWISESENSFTLQPGASRIVTVTLNAGDASVTQPGTYTAALTVSDDTPYRSVPVSVTMDAAPPETWAEITGTVTGAVCGGGTKPLNGAMVQIDSSANSYTLSADKNGGYALWLDASNSPLTVIAALDNWQPTVATVNLSEKKAATADFTLQPDSC